MSNRLVYLCMLSRSQTAFAHYDRDTCDDIFKKIEMIEVTLR